MRLLAESYTSRDQVSLIPFYGDKAEVRHSPGCSTTPTPMQGLQRGTELLILRVRSCCTMQSQQARSVVGGYGNGPSAEAGMFVE